MPAFQITPLNKKHDRSTFSYGHPSLDDYLRLKASQDMKRKVAAVFVLTEPESQAVKAYYTLSATTVLLRDLPAQLQKNFPDTLRCTRHSLDDWLLIILPRATALGVFY